MRGRSNRRISTGGAILMCALVSGCGGERKSSAESVIEASPSPGPLSLAGLGLSRAVVFDIPETLRKAGGLEDSTAGGSQAGKRPAAGVEQGCRDALPS
ncbi:hypothetical protein EBZ80_16185 [bacterium]|nr:hypothetical protein [bacterium]